MSTGKELSSYYWRAPDGVLIEIEEEDGSTRKTGRDRWINPEDWIEATAYCARVTAHMEGLGFSLVGKAVGVLEVLKMADARTVLAPSFAGHSDKESAQVPSMRLWARRGLMELAAKRGFENRQERAARVRAALEKTK